MIRLDIFADPACPWCYLGKANLDRALESRADHPFLLEWHPFQLNPGMPRDGVPRADHLLRIFGTQSRTVEAHLRLAELGRAAGLDFDFEKMTREPNTFDALRLIHWAGLEGRQSAMVAALFRAHWREGRDIGNPEVLADLAQEAGLDRAAMARLLASDADAGPLRDRIYHARQRGVTSVPTFILADHYVISGAQSPEFWMQVMDDLAQQGQVQ